MDDGVRKECRGCGKAFVPRGNGGKPQLWCSRKCAGQVYEKARKQRKAATRKQAAAPSCAECGGPIAHLARGRPRRFCSDQCKARMVNRQARRRVRPAAKPELTLRACLWCGKKFQPRRGDQIYCSNMKAPYCAVDASRARKKDPRAVQRRVVCEDCGVEFTTNTMSAKFCSGLCRHRHHARQASRRRGPVHPGSALYSDREIFDRDAWTCGICGEAIDPAVPRRFRDGASIDHTVPLSLGGADAPENVVAAHNRCNRRKGAKQRLT
jgi:5-methylcytosine-specific restriction endonuclease McrA/endogenous inhibitor of DNA gyrase (YacG/DUF329 family)